MSECWRKKSATTTTIHICKVWIGNDALQSFDMKKQLTHNSSVISIVWTIFIHADIYAHTHKHKLIRNRLLATHYTHIYRHTCAANGGAGVAALIAVTEFDTLEARFRMNCMALIKSGDIDNWNEITDQHYTQKTQLIKFTSIKLISL